MTYSPFPVVTAPDFASVQPRPPIVRMGGKVRLSAFLAPLLRQFRADFYCEPFCGSFAVFLRLFQQRYFYPYSHRFPVLNDADRLLVNLFATLRSAPTDLLKAIFFSPYSRADHDSALSSDLSALADILSHSPETPFVPSPQQLHLASAYLINAWQSFNAQPGGTWATCHTPRPTQHSLVKWLSVPHRLRYAAVALRHAYLECGDAIDTVARWAGTGTVFYLDPPYYGKEFYYDASADMTADYHRRLAETLAVVPAAAVVVSYYPVAEVLDLYPGDIWERHFLYATVSSKGVLRSSKERQRERAIEVVFVRKDAKYGSQQLSLW